MDKPPAAKQAMYELINPDPLRQVTARALARSAGCSVGMVSDLRNGKLPGVSHRIASGIAAALGVDIGALFREMDRVSWERRP